MNKDTQTLVEGADLALATVYYNKIKQGKYKLNSLNQRIQKVMKTDKVEYLTLKHVQTLLTYDKKMENK